METKDGLYTIRSGYYLIKEWEKYQYEDTSNLNNYISRWQKYGKSMYDLGWLRSNLISKGMLDPTKLN
jgi:hypothetical protein